MTGVELKAVLRDGPVAFGTFVSELATPAIAEMLAAVGFDFLVVDMEHSPTGTEAAAAIVMAARALGIAPLVRVAWHDRPSILRPLDMGAAGIVVPMVEDEHQASSVVRYAKYPPTGARGVALKRAHSRYRDVEPAQYTREANAETIVLAQIETAAAVEHAAAIARVPGIDGLFVGPSDLSHNLGYPEQLSAPEVQRVLAATIDVALRAGVAAGIHLSDPSSAGEWQRAGIRMITLGSDVAFLLAAARRALEVARGAAEAAM